METIRPCLFLFSVVCIIMEEKRTEMNESENESKFSREEVINLSMSLGQVLLQSGAETSRVEDSIRRFCQKNGCNHLQVFVTPTVIVIGDVESGEATRVSRVISRSTNLHIISQINDFTYQVGYRQWSYGQAMTWLDKKRKCGPMYGTMLTAFASGFAAACFTRMLGGKAPEFWVAFLVGGLCMLLLRKLSSYQPGAFWENAVAGAAIGGMSIGCCHYLPGCSLDIVIGGSLMPFLPGTAFVNSVRDYMGGDLVSGNCRFAEALLFAVSIALGLAFSLKLWLLWS